jgi:very-short-patch-repair endonuclease
MQKKTLIHRRELRKNPTDAESHLWKYLRRRQMLEHKFRRQHPIGPYIVDFVCLDKKLVLEIDGNQHLDQEGYDERRSRFLQERGYRVLRFWNNQVFLQTEAVLRAIEYALEEVVPESQGPPGHRLKETPIPPLPPL